MFIAVSVPLFAAAKADRTNAEPPGRPAWKWTFEERLAQRFDPVKIRERAIAYQAEHPHLLAQQSVRTRADIAVDDRAVVSYVIDGRRNPELFMPHELFATLLTVVLPQEPLRSRQRDYYREDIRRFGFDDSAFWTNLEHAVSTAAPLAQWSAQPGEELCRMRHRALQSARAFFGDRLDAFLYEVIAPSQQHAVTTNLTDPAAALKRAAQGCPQ
ncbi:MAG TPA: hypothetical protein VF883_01200 [Thermoanaerobaculia bacterium]|jgi:hypothetical protein